MAKNIKEKKEEKQEELRIEGLISEMVSSFEDLKIDVPIGEEVDVVKLTEGDGDPMFVTVEALNPQISHNGRRYTPELIAEIARQINELKPDAYLGHLSDEERPFKAPESQTIWLGALVKEIRGKSRLFVKGYVLPYATKLKQYLRASKAANKDVGVSIYGIAEQKWNESYKAWDIYQFQLESIDWARPGSKGAVDTKHLAITKEMKEDYSMEKEQVIKEMSLADLKENNPALFDEVKNLGFEDAKTEFEGKVAEMKDAKEKAEQTIGEMTKEHEDLVKSHISTELEKKVENKAVREFVQKLVVSEMTGKDMTKTSADESIAKVVDSEEVKTLVTEMTSQSKMSIEDKSDDGEKRRFTKL